jgi:hypothetical protein
LNPRPDVNLLEWICENSAGLTVCIFSAAIARVPKSVASALFYNAVGALAGSLNFPLSPKIGGSSKAQSMRSDFGPTVTLQKISSTIQG